MHGACLSHWVDVDAEVKGPSDRYVPESTAPWPSWFIERSCQCSPWLRRTKFPLPGATVCGLDMLTETALKRRQHSRRSEFAEGYLNYKQASELWQNTTRLWPHHTTFLVCGRKIPFFLHSLIATWITLSAHKLGLRKWRMWDMGASQEPRMAQCGRSSSWIPLLSINYLCDHGIHTSSH